MMMIDITSGRLLALGEEKQVQQLALAMFEQSSQILGMQSQGQTANKKDLYEIHRGV